MSAKRISIIALIIVCVALAIALAATGIRLELLQQENRHLLALIDQMTSGNATAATEAAAPAATDAIYKNEIARAPSETAAATASITPESTQTRPDRKLSTVERFAPAASLEMQPEFQSRPQQRPAARMLMTDSRQPAVSATASNPATVPDSANHLANEDAAQTSSSSTDEGEEVERDPNAAGLASPSVAGQQISFPRSAWTFSGFTSPESSLQSALWAGANDLGALLRNIDPSELERMKKETGDGDREALERLARSFADVAAFQVVKNERFSDSDLILTADLADSSGRTETKRFAFRRDKSEWRFAGAVNH